MIKDWLKYTCASGCEKNNNYEENRRNYWTLKKTLRAVLLKCQPRWIDSNTEPREFAQVRWKKLNDWMCVIVWLCVCVCQKTQVDSLQSRIIGRNEIAFATLITMVIKSVPAPFEKTITVVIDMGRRRKIAKGKHWLLLEFMIGWVSNENDSNRTWTNGRSRLRTNCVRLKYATKEKEHRLVWLRCSLLMMKAWVMFVAYPINGNPLALEIVDSVVKDDWSSELKICWPNIVRI
jgi:hypothetical protein